MLLNDLEAMEQNSAVFFLLQWVSRWKSCIMKGGDHSSEGSEREIRPIAVCRFPRKCFGKSVAAGQAIGHSVAAQCRAKLNLVILRSHSVAARSASDVDLCASGPDRCRFSVTGWRRGETATVINYIFAHRQLY